jgi:hypothetical protein
MMTLVMRKNNWAYTGPTQIKAKNKLPSFSKCIVFYWMVQLINIYLFFSSSIKFYCYMRKMMPHHASLLAITTGILWYS